MTQEIIDELKTSKVKIEDAFKQNIELFKKAEIEKVYPEDGLNPKSSIESVNILIPKVKGKLTEEIAEYITFTVSRYEVELESLRPEEAKNDEHIQELLKKIGIYRKSLSSQPKEVFSKISPQIDRITNDI
jgi:hypothetical protein